MTHASTQMNNVLEDIVLNEASQSQKEKHRTVLFPQGS